MGKQEEITLGQWIEYLQSRGRYAFSLSLMANELPGYTEIAAKRALSRLTTKGRIISIYKSYYLIIPPQYSSKGILPPALFLDGLMKNIERPYYLALLNAAGFYGAFHQQPQEFFVVTNFPVLRTTQKKGLRINYIDCLLIYNLVMVVFLLKSKAKGKVHNQTMNNSRTFRFYCVYTAPLRWFPSFSFSGSIHTVAPTQTLSQLTTNVFIYFQQRANP